MRGVTADARAGEITIVGGGLAGLTAAITCAEAGARVTLLEARNSLGGRARSCDGPYVANLGPHVLYKDGRLWRWLAKHGLKPPHAGAPLAAVRVRLDGELRRMPPLRSVLAAIRLRLARAPVETDFRTRAAEHVGERTAEMLAAAAGGYTFYHDPGELSAAFVWERTVRALLSPPPKARYLIGGWGSLVATLEARARGIGITIRTGERVRSLPPTPAILACELADAAELLGADELSWKSGATLCVDLGLERRPEDPFVVSDLDEAGWVERFSAADSTLAPRGEELVQAQMPIRPGESEADTAARLETLIDISLPGWRERRTWQRRQVMRGRTGALDLPGMSWRERPAIDRGGGVYLAGDMVAAPGLLSEVAWASAIDASRRALAALAAKPLALP